MEEILSVVPAVIGSPNSIEKFLGETASDAMQSDEAKPKTDATNSSSMSSDVAAPAASNALSSDFLHLFNNAELSDITFVLKDNQKLFAHKNILVTRCTYFRSLFLNGMKESFQKEIEVKAWDPEIFITVIRFIYSDQVLFSAQTQLDRVWSLFMAAKYYGLDRLQRLCEQFIVLEKITADCVCLLWNTSLEMDAKEVEACCRRYFAHNFETATVSDGFQFLHRDLFLSALKSPELIVSNQDKVAQAVLSWGRAQMSNPASGVSKQDLFTTFFPLLRMPHRTSLVEQVKQSVSLLVVVRSQPLQVMELVNCEGPSGCKLNVLFDRIPHSQDDVRSADQAMR